MEHTDTDTLPHVAAGLASTSLRRTTFRMILRATRKGWITSEGSPAALRTKLPHMVGQALEQVSDDGDNRALCSGAWAAFEFMNHNLKVFSKAVRRAELEAQAVRKKSVEHVQFGPMKMPGSRDILPDRTSLE